MSCKNTLLVLSLVLSVAAVQATDTPNTEHQTRRAKAAAAVKKFFKERFKKQSPCCDVNKSSK